MPSTNGSIADEETVGGLPGLPNEQSSETPGEMVEVRALANREYVAGRKYTWYNQLPQALPWAIDDVANELGSDLYEKMLKDAQVRAVVNVYKAGILEDGVTLNPAIEKKDVDGYQQAVDLNDQAEKMLANLETPLDDVLWDMGDAVALGNRMAEQVFDLDAINGKRQYVLHRLTVKPRESVAFVVDAYMNVLGILGLVPGQPFSVQQGTLLSDIGHTPNILPRSKFAILSFRPKNSDPRGQSLLRPAFDPWNQKQQLKREFLKYLTQFATPSLIGFSAENAQPYPVTNVDGSIQVDALGNTVYRSPEDDMLAALESLVNGFAIAFPYGASVQPIEMHGDGAPFLNAFSFLDLQITKAVLHQTLATEEGQHQSRAASSTHKDILDTITRQGKRPVERMLERDVLGTWMRLNGLEKLLPLMPRVTLGRVEQEDLSPLWTATANLRRAGYLHESQFAELDRKIGVPERTPSDASSLPVTERVTVAEDAGSVPPPDIEGTGGDDEPDEPVN